MSILPNLPDEINSIIVCFADNQSLVNLSGVNKTAYQTLTNDVFFKKLFEMQHPQIAKLKNTFQILCATHPGNCWKIVCCALSDGAWFHASNAFYKEGIPVISVYLNSEKIRLETEIKSICGSYYADPHSSIDQAWKALDTCKQEYNIFCSKIKELLNPVASAYSEGERHQIHTVLATIVQSYMEKKLSDEQLKEDLMFLSGNDYVYLNRNHIQNILSWCSLVRNSGAEMTAKRSEMDKLELIYHNLETKKNALQISLGKINTQLDLSNNPNFLECLISEHEANIRGELGNAATTKKNLMILPILKECHSIILSLESVEDPSPEALNQIRKLINSHSDLMADIWGSLYWRCANNAQEDQWSEKHFPKFLKQLNQILKLQIDIDEDIFRRCEIQRSLISDSFIDRCCSHSAGVISNLNECLEYCSTPDSINETWNHSYKSLRIIYLINLYPQLGIWESLYKECANGAQEDQWSENHFHEFLGPLKNILLNSIEMCKNEIERNGLKVPTNTKYYFRMPTDVTHGPTLKIDLMS